MRKLFLSHAWLAAALCAWLAPAHAANGTWTVIGWNNLGMHCMDSDYSLFAILPPYNTIHAQLLDPGGKLITGASGYAVTYKAVADADGSINSTSIGKSNFWQCAMPLFGLPQPLAPDTGLTGVLMPGLANEAHPMTWDAANGWWVAEGLPLTPYDDALHKNPYPMLQLEARAPGGGVVASTQIVAPVSDEMDCRACHASGSGPAAQPQAGWVNDANAERDYRLNILRLHDEKQAANANYPALLTAFGYDAAGLFATASVHGRPVLCAACHASNALGTAGAAGVPPLTTATHALHARVTDPASGLTLDDSANRSACYRCHPGSATRCLRGAMGNAVATDGAMAMQCQSCHGTMSAVGAAQRQGWLQEPACQNCHTGTATLNSGAIRYTSVFDADGHPRQAADATFATNTDTPAQGLSLYRFSSGHGGLKCEACHGATHAEYPSSHRNDNVQSVQLQGHEGMLVECTACHGAQAPNAGGPHGMHGVGQGWISAHGDAVESAGGAQACQACHGSDYRGTVLSRSKADRAVTTEFGPKTFWRGFQIGCYTCHAGPQSESANPNHPAVAQSASVQTPSGVALTVPLLATDADGNALTLRIVSQPEHGTAGLSGSIATYYPDAQFAGTDAFTFAAWDGSTDSNLARVEIAVRAERIFADGFGG